MLRRFPAAPDAFALRPAAATIRRALRLAARTLAWFAAALFWAWSVGALGFDFPVAPGVVAGGFALTLPAAVVFLPGRRLKLAAPLVGSTLVLAWWLTLPPSNDRPWQPDVAQTAWAEVAGDVVTLHHVRRCDYRTATDYTPRWETRTVRLSALTGIDLAVNYWGSPWAAHPIASFQFADALPVCFSIELRRAAGQSASALGGIYRQYELIYVVADERDVLRVRTNFRRGEDVYLYRTTASPAQARDRFLDYLGALNALRDHPRWYHGVTTNCTTSIRAQRDAARRMPWDWRMLVNGKLDEMLYERGLLRTDGLPFAELKRRARINDAAGAAGDGPEFSARIRDATPGFQKAGAAGD